MPAKYVYRQILQWKREPLPVVGLGRATDCRGCGLSQISNPDLRLASRLEEHNELMDALAEAPTRERLLHFLYEAAELEHNLMCTYLYAAFSLRSGTAEGLSPTEAETVARWRRTIIDVAIDEMSHLTAIWNITSARWWHPTGRSRRIFHWTPAGCRHALSFASHRSMRPCCSTSSTWSVRQHRLNGMARDLLRREPSGEARPGYDWSPCHWTTTRWVSSTGTSARDCGQCQPDRATRTCSSVTRRCNCQPPKWTSRVRDA